MITDEKQQSPHDSKECHNPDCPTCIVYNFVPPTEPIRVHVIRKNKHNEKK